MKTRYAIVLVSMGKSLALAIIFILAVSSLIMVESASAQSIPKPSVPEFTAKYVDRSYTVPANTSIDPFTGKTVTNPAQYIENQTIQISIKNQTISSSDFLYYKIRMKGHFSQEWTNISFVQANPQSEYTELTFALAGNNASGPFVSSLEISSGDTADFQVQAQIWHYVPSDNPNSQFGGGWLFRISDYSDWSNTQTITIPETANTSPNPSPTVPEFPLVSAIFLLAVVSVSLVYFRRRKKP
jgi:hypothetical protein